MPSTIADFQLPVKTVSPNVRIADTYSQNSNQQSNNIWRITCTLAGDGISSKVPIISWDTEALHKAGQVEFSYNSLRVFDSNGTSPLAFSLEAPNTKFNTSLVINFGTAWTGSRTFFLEFGNPGLSKVSEPPITISSNKITARFCPKLDRNIYDQIRVGFNDSRYLDQGKKIEYDQWWGGVNAAKANITKADEVGFTGGTLGATYEVIKFNKAYFPTQNLLDENKSLSFGIRTIFIVAKHLDNTNNTIIGGKADDIEVKIENNQVIVSKVARFVIHTHTTSLTQNVDNLIMVQYSGTQIITKINSGTAQTTNFNGGFANNVLVLGASLSQIITNSSTATHHNGTIREVLISDSVLSTVEITQMEQYLQRLHQTVGSFTTTTTFSLPALIPAITHTCLSYAPITSYSRKETLKDFRGLADESSTVEFQDIFQKTLFTGISPEPWSTPNTGSLSFNVTQESQIPANFSYGRKVIASSTSTTDRVLIRMLHPTTGSNINSPGSFNLTNQVEPTTYLSDDNDYISMMFFCTDVSKLDLTTCFIRFEHFITAATKRASFDQSINTVVSNQTVKIKIPKSSFIGTGIWSDMAFAVIITKCLPTMTVDCYYSNLELTKNYKTDLELTKNQVITLGNSVSSDDELTYYTSTVSEGIISQRNLNNDDFSLDYQSYLTKVRTRTFGSLPSWLKGRDSVTYITAQEGLFPGNNKRLYFSYFLKKVLNFVFSCNPNLYDIDLDLLSPQDTANLSGTVASSTDQYITNLNYFHILATDTVGDIIDRLLDPVFGILTYNHQTNKLEARNFYKLYSTGSTLPAPYIIPTNMIESKGYTQSTGSNKLYNQLYIQRYQDQFSNYILKLDQSIGLKAGEFLTRTIDIDSYNQSEKMGYLSAYSQGLIIGNFITLYTEPYSNLPSGGQGIYMYSKKVGSKIEIKISNENTYDIDIELALLGSMIGFSVYKIPNVIDSLTLSSETSIRTNGVHNYPIDSKYAYIVADSTTFEMKPAGLYQELINNFSSEKEIFQVKLIYDPSVEIGLVVRVKNREDKTLTCTVIGVETVSEGENQSQLITVREI